MFKEVINRIFNQAVLVLIMHLYDISGTITYLKPFKIQLHDLSELSTPITQLNIQAIYYSINILILIIYIFGI